MELLLTDTLSEVRSWMPVVAYCVVPFIASPAPFVKVGLLM